MMCLIGADLDPTMVCFPEARPQAPTGIPTPYSSLKIVPSSLPPSVPPATCSLQPPSTDKVHARPPPPPLSELRFICSCDVFSGGGGRCRRSRDSRRGDPPGADLGGPRARGRCRGGRRRRPGGRADATTPPGEGARAGAARGPSPRARPAGRRRGGRRLRAAEGRRTAGRRRPRDGDGARRLRPRGRADGRRGRRCRQGSRRSRGGTGPPLRSRPRSPREKGAGDCRSARGQGRPSRTSPPFDRISAGSREGGGRRRGRPRDGRLRRRGRAIRTREMPRRVAADEAAGTADGGTAPPRTRPRAGGVRARASRRTRRRGGAGERRRLASGRTRRRGRPWGTSPRTRPRRRKGSSDRLQTSTQHMKHSEYNRKTTQSSTMANSESIPSEPRQFPTHAGYLVPVEIKDSPQHGVGRTGVCAAEHIAEGTKLWAWTPSRGIQSPQRPELLHRQECRKRPTKRTTLSEAGMCLAAVVDVRSHASDPPDPKRRRERRRCRVHHRRTRQR